ncbi:MAG: ABC transporter permease [Arenimonas sp.]
MSALITVFKKELRDMFRDRRTVMISLVIGTLLGPLLMFGMLKLIVNRASTQQEKPLVLPVVGAEHAPNLVNWLKGQNIVIKPAPINIDAAIADQSEDVVMRISPDFGKQWRKSLPAEVELIHDSTRQDASIPVERIENLLENYGRTVGTLRLLARGVSPSAMQTVQISHRDLATPQSRAGQILSFLPYLLILTAFLGGAYLIIDVTAGERERQSLEPLLATPASRSAIMSGKILAACAFGMISLIISLMAFKICFLFSTGFGVKVELLMGTILLLLVVLIPILLIGACLLTLIAASVKSVKEAQSYMSILMMLPLLPTIILMVNPVKNQLWMFAVPFLSQNQMILKLVRGEVISSAEWAVYLSAGFGLAAILWAIAARLYHREKLAISA